MTWQVTWSLILGFTLSAVIETLASLPSKIGCRILDNQLLQYLGSHALPDSGQETVPKISQAG